MTGEEDLRYLVETLCWMGGGGVWSVEMIAEQLGREGDAQLAVDVDHAADLGLITAQPGGVVLSDAGWRFAAAAEAL